MHRMGVEMINERGPAPSRGVGLQRTSTNDEAMLLLQDRQKSAIDLNYLLQQIMKDNKIATTYQAFRVRYLRAMGKLRPAEYEEPEDMTDEDAIRDFLKELRRNEREKKERCSRLQSMWVLYDTLASDKPSALNTEDSQIEAELDEFEKDLFDEWHDFAEEVIARAQIDGNEGDSDILDWHLELKEIRKDLKLIQRRNDERNEMRKRDLRKVRDMVRLRRGEDVSERTYDSDDSSEEQSIRTSKTSKTSKTSRTNKKKKTKSRKEKHSDKDESERGDDDDDNGTQKKGKRSSKKTSKKKDKSKKKSSRGGSQDALLEEVFPPHIAKALRAGRKVEPESKECVTIFFSDIVGFTNISSSISPLKVSDMLDRLYQKFDALSHEHDVFKVETIGDSWMGVTNLNKIQPDHAQRVAHFALDALKAAQDTWIDEEDHSLGKLNLRVGFHSGPVVASVVGSRNPRYCLFGDTVNTSSRMESHSLPGRIHCSNSSAELLKKNDAGLVLVPRGEIEVKGKGMMETFFIRDNTSVDPESLSPVPPSPQRISRTLGREKSWRNASRPVRSFSREKSVEDLMIAIVEDGPEGQ